MDAGIGVDEGEIRALLGGEAGSLPARHLIHLSPAGLGPPNSRVKTSVPRN
jgi:hypothetical protein